MPRGTLVDAATPGGALKASYSRLERPIISIPCIALPFQRQFELPHCG